MSKNIFEVFSQKTPKKKILKKVTLQQVTPQQIKELKKVTHPPLPIIYNYFDVINELEKGEDVTKVLQNALCTAFTMKLFEYLISRGYYVKDFYMNFYKNIGKKMKFLRNVDLSHVVVGWGIDLLDNLAEFYFEETGIESIPYDYSEKVYFYELILLQKRIKLREKELKYVIRNAVGLASSPFYSEIIARLCKKPEVMCYAIKKYGMPTDNIFHRVITNRYIIASDTFRQFHPHRELFMEIILEQCKRGVTNSLSIYIETVMSQLSELEPVVKYIRSMYFASVRYISLKQTKKSLQVFREIMYQITFSNAFLEECLLVFPSLRKELIDNFYESGILTALRIVERQYLPPDPEVVVRFLKKMNRSDLFELLPNNYPELFQPYAGNPVLEYYIKEGSHPLANHLVTQKIIPVQYLNIPIAGTTLFEFGLAWDEKTLAECLQNKFSIKTPEFLESVIYTTAGNPQLTDLLLNNENIAHFGPEYSISIPHSDNQMLLERTELLKYYFSRGSPCCSNILATKGKYFRRNVFNMLLCIKRKKMIKPPRCILQCILEYIDNGNYV